MNKIKLLAKVDDSDANGFSATLEGRKFLRFCYSRYIEMRRNPKDGSRATAHGKVAESVADSGNSVASTAQALTRWCDNLQSDLWTDSVKAERVAQRVEKVIATEPLIAQLLNDRAVKIRSSDFAEALTAFWFPPSQSYARSLEMQKTKRFVGVYTIWTYSGNGDRYRDYYYCRSVHFVVVQHAELPIFLIQEFSIREADGDSIIFDRRSGFGVYRDDGRALHYLISYRNPAQRWVELFRVDDEPSDAPNVSEADRRWSAIDFAISGAGDEGIRYKRDSMKDFIGHHDPNKLLIIPAEKSVCEFAAKVIGESMWDIMI